MHVITSVNDKYFSLNGVRYVRNYLSKPYGNKLEIYNCYDRKDVLVEGDIPENFTVNGVIYTNIALLQEALLNIIYDLGSSAIQSPVKAIKLITSASAGFAGSTYTLQTDDDKKWLLFNINTPFNIRIPINVFIENTEIEGHSIGNGQPTFTNVTGMFLYHGPSEMPRVAEKHGVFGLKFKSVTEVLLFGKLELL